MTSATLAFNANVTLSLAPENQYSYVVQNVTFHELPKTKLGNV